MLKYKVGNLILAALGGEVDAILHCANCQCTMKSGFARELVHEMQMAKWADDNTSILTPEEKLGTFSHVYTRAVHVFNLYGQLDYGTNQRQVNYGALAEAMTRAKLWLLENEDKYVKIGIPMLGAGLAGGDWGIISELAEHIFKDFDVTVYVLDEKHIPVSNTLNDDVKKRPGRPKSNRV